MEQYNEVAAYMADPTPTTVLGKGRLANFQDARNANLLESSGLYLGRFEGQPIYYNGDSHLLSYGKTGSGKGRDVILANLAHIKNESLIVTDIKNGENAYASVRCRKTAHGHRCIALNPSNIAGFGTFRLNPCQNLIDIAKAGHAIDGEDREFISLFIPMTEAQEGHPDSWPSHAARRILGLRAKYLAYFRPHECNPCGLWDMVNGDNEEIEAKFQEMIDCPDETISKVARSYLTTFKKADKQWEAYKTVLDRAVAPYEPNSTFAEATKTSDFDPADLARIPTTVYAMLPTDRIAHGKQWLTLVLSTMIERISSTPGTVRTTLILDELANLPYMPIIPKTLKLLRGGGVRLWGFCQSRNSLAEVGYAKETIREFEDAAGVLQLWEVEDTQLIRDIEVWGGKTGVVVRNSNMSGGGGLNGSFATSETARPVFQAEDIRAVGYGEQLLKISGCPHIFHAERVPWFEFPLLEQHLNDPRDITNGKAAHWVPVKRKRMLALPSPPPEPAPPSPEPDDRALLDMALVENEELQAQLDKLKKKEKKRKKLAKQIRQELARNAST